MKKALLILICFLMIVATIGCSASDGGIVGAWKLSSDGSSIEFNEDGGYTMGEYRGKYSVDGSSVTLHAPEGVPVDDYLVSVDGNRLVGSSGDTYATRK